MDVSKSYEILEKVLRQGFHTTGFKQAGVSYVLKTLNPIEKMMARYHSSGQGLREYRLYRMAYSVFMFNGTNCLVDRSKTVLNLVDAFKGMPENHFALLDEASLILQKSYERCFSVLEGFCYSSDSRALWKIRQGSFILNEANVGIEGVTTVGMPAISELWGLVNLTLDAEEKERSEMSHFMFLASAENPKGVKKVAQNLEVDQKMKTLEREALVKYGSEANKKLQQETDPEEKNKWTAPLDTAQDLVDELERQMKGIKDKHDLFIEETLEKERIRMEKAAAERERRLDELRKRRGEDPATGSFEVSQEEMDRIKKEGNSMEIALQKARESVKNAPVANKRTGRRVIGNRSGYVVEGKHNG